MKLSISRSANAFALAAFVLGSGALSGCSISSGQITPTPAVQSDIQTAFTAICGSGGLLAAAAPFATTGNVATYYGEAQALCANGVPTNEIVAGVDIFDLYLDLSTALSKKSSIRQAKVLKARHG